MSDSATQSDIPSTGLAWVILAASTGTLLLLCLWALFNQPTLFPDKYPASLEPTKSPALISASNVEQQDSEPQVTQLAAAKLEEERLAAERQAAEIAEAKLEKERLTAEQQAAEIAEVKLVEERLAAEQQAAEIAEAKLEKERLAAEQQAAEIAEAKLEEERLAAEQQAAEIAEAKLEEERLAAEQQAAEIAEAKLEEERLAAERQAAEIAEAKLEEERLAAEQQAAERAEAKLEEERLAAEQMAAEQLAAEQLVEAKLDEERLAAEKLAALALAEAAAIEQRVAALAGPVRAIPEVETLATTDNAVSVNGTPFEVLRREELSALSGLAARVRFLPSEIDIRESSKKPLDRLFELLFLYSETEVTVQVMSNEYEIDNNNRLISRERALALVNYLIERGLDEERFRIRALGKERLPFDSHRVTVIATVSDDD